MDAVIADEILVQSPPATLKGLRLAIPKNRALDDLDAPVSSASERAAIRLSRDGVSLVSLHLPALDELPVIAAKANVAAAEAYVWHRPLLATKAALYDPMMRSRFESGASVG
jgi:aspartyl-tRNA(Asn)/glutamyl-tRNA(Gln) amidotransferase subunit A